MARVRTFCIPLAVLLVLSLLPAGATAQVAGPAGPPAAASPGPSSTNAGPGTMRLDPDCKYEREVDQEFDRCVARRPSNGVRQILPLTSAADPEIFHGGWDDAVSGEIQIKNAPALATGRIWYEYYFVRGMDDHLWVRSSEYLLWQTWRQLAPLIYSDPDCAMIWSTALNDWKIYCAAFPAYEGLTVISYNFRTFETTTEDWGGGLFAYSPAIEVYELPGDTGPRVAVYAVTPEGVMRTKGPSGWYDLPGAWTSSPDCIGAPSTYCFARGTDFSVWNVHNNGSAWEVGGSWGGYLVSEPSVIMHDFPQREFHVYAEGTDNRLWGISCTLEACGGWYHADRYYPVFLPLLAR